MCVQAGKPHRVSAASWPGNTRDPIYRAAVKLRRKPTITSNMLSRIVPAAALLEQLVKKPA